MDAPFFSKSQKEGSIVKKLALMAVKIWLFGSVLEVILVIPGTLKVVHAGEFFCDAGNVTCLIDAINKANLHNDEDTINLAAGTYTLTSIDDVGTLLHGSFRQKII
jgi:hypothetical protein